MVGGSCGLYAPSWEILGAVGRGRGHFRCGTAGGASCFVLGCVSVGATSREVTHHI